MSKRSRRDFLKLTAGTATTVAAAQGCRALAAGKEPAVVAVATGNVDIWVTAGKKRYAPADALSWQPAVGTARAARIVVDLDKKQQPVLGFGGAFTDAACWTISRMPEDKREALLHELFHPTEMGFNAGRLCIGSSDYARSAYTYDEGPADPELKRFSVERDQAYILPTLRRARAQNPEMFLLGSPWSPPSWMKDNDRLQGGTIRTRYLDVYGQYFVKFLEAYKAAGVEVNAVSSQNEVDTDQDGKMPACLFPQEVEVRFVGKSLGPALERAGLQTKIWLIDHNYNLWGRAIATLDDPTVNQYTKAIAWHGYAGDVEWMQRVAAVHPDCEMYWTEGGPEINDPRYLTDWAKWSKTFAGILRNGARCIIAWNLALDEAGKPNIGPFPCGGIVTVDSKTNEVTRSGQYWAFAHHARAIRRHAVVIPSSGTIQDVDHVAARNADGCYALVLTNGGATARTVEVQAGSNMTQVALPPDSVTTLTWY
jgi:glucosylceramidase